MKPVRLMFAADRAVFRHLPVVINSIQRASPAPLEIGIVTKDIPSWASRRLCAAFPSVGFTEYKSDGIIPAGLSTKYALSPLTFARIFMPGITPWSRFVYLDVDMIVKGDISEIYEMDLEGSPCGAVFHNDELNAGMMVFDAEQWRRRGLTKPVLDFAIANKPKDADQESLQAVMSDCFQRLDATWNVLIDPMWGTAPSASQISRANILHFITGFKPWNLGRLLLEPELRSEWDSCRLPVRLPYDWKKEAGILAWQIRILGKRLLARGGPNQ